MKVIYFEPLKNEIQKIWWTMPSTYHNFEVNYKKEKDLALKDLSSVLINVVNSKDVDIKKELPLDRICSFVVENLNISKESVDVLFNDAYFDYSQGFIERAKKVDPSLSSASIFQALRNVWTMHSMQIYLNEPVALTDSVFAYSMLYPLTDNFLDDPKLSKKEKMDFNQRFRNKIKTGHGKGLNAKETQIFDMIDLIEIDWDRQKYPKVYEALLSILDGQNMSLCQQHLDGIFSHDILGISFYKGGTSVLADAYLVKGNLTPSEEKFAFYYGVILQLADDLQDIKEDLKNHHYTVMNLQHQNGHLDSLFSKYMNFIDYFLKEIYAKDTKEQRALSELTKESIQLLVFAAVLKHKSSVSKTLFLQVKKANHFSRKAYEKSEKLFLNLV